MYARKKKISTTGVLCWKSRELASFGPGYTTQAEYLLSIETINGAERVEGNSCF